MAPDNPQPNALPAALRYAAHGFRVVPIAPAGKNPILRDWPNRASNQPDDLRAWWQKRPDAGVGLLMGTQPSGDIVVAVDIDNHNPAQLGADTIRDLEDAYGPLPDTWTQITGSGGEHRLFRVPHPIRNDAGRLLGPGVDIRGDGGQIVAAPTIHPNGRPYEWDDQRAPWDIPIADAPGWLLALLDATPDQPRERPTTPYDGPERPGDRWAAVTPWRALLEPDGATYLATVRDGHELWARPGLAGQDLHTSASLYYKGSDVLYVFTTAWPGLQADTSYTKLGYLAATRFNGDHTAAARWLTAEGYGTPHDNADGLLGDTLTGPQSDDDAEPSRLRRNLLIGRAILDLPPVEWLIHETVQLDGLTVVYGPPKSYKTFVTLDMALHIQAGITWRGLAVQPTRVLYIVAEGAPGVGPRAAAWANRHGQTIDNMAWIVVAPNLFHEAGADVTEIVAIAVELGVGLVVVDTLARATPGAEENSAKDMGIVVRHLDWIRENARCAVMVVHHTGKDQTRGMRGSNALQGAVDTSIEVIGDRHAVNARIVDQKNAESDRGWWWKPSKENPSIVLEPTAGLEGSGEVRDLNILRQLALIDAGGGVGATTWLDAVVEREICGKTTFHERLRQFVEDGMVAKSGTESRPRYGLSAAGLRFVESATTE